MRKAENLKPSCGVVTKSGSLNFLEPSGVLRACNGTALPLHLPLSTKLKRSSHDLVVVTNVTLLIDKISNIKLKKNVFLYT